MALPMFMITLFVSAFLLFLVQPMIGKMILPKLGGTPQVWNTCMVFFQAALLAGYAYTHSTSTRLPTRRQIIIHAIFLFVPLAILLPTPFNVVNWVPDLGINPIFSTIVLLGTIVGIPFIVVATSAPLLQRWFAQTGHPASKDPYFLYAASNVGSLAGLLLYPALIEWLLPLRSQAWFWAGGYVVMIGLILFCASLVWKTAPKTELATADGPPPEPESEPAPEPEKVEDTSTAVTADPQKTSRRKKRRGKRGDRSQGPAASSKAKEKETIGGFAAPSIARPDEPLTWGRRLRWVVLAAIPSSLMLGVTTFVTTDLSPIPLFWIVPLMLYLLSFILVFSKWPVEWTGTPHTVMLYMQPFAIALMVLFNIMSHGVGAHGLGMPVFINVLGFFLTAMVCHGELARDRPSTQHLTEFYLWMSVGGVTGGIFNGILAPLIFLKNWEYPIAIIVACFMRPKMAETDWADEAALGILDPAGQHAGKGGRRQAAEIAVQSNYQNLPSILDFVLPVVLVVIWAICWFVLGGMFPRGSNMPTAIAFGLPLILGCAFLMRPIRFGMGVGALVIIGIMTSMADNRTTIFSDRSYFGMISVNRQATPIRNQERTAIEQTFTQLTHGQTDHGMNFQKPPARKYYNKPDSDLTRLATTYYHRRCPVGMAMKRFDWWRNEPFEHDDPITLVELNTFAGDARLPVSIIGSGVMPLGSTMPLGQIVSAWSEPPYATVGLGTGTMASYGRPYQHVHFYEIDNHIRRLSLPTKLVGDNLTYFGPDVDQGLNNPNIYFNYLLNAAKRGSNVQVLMGDARTRMALPYSTYDEKRELAGGEQGGGGDHFYHLIAVDAFSSDAIPVHLLTKEAITMYFSKMVPEGLLCLHTSNKYVDLVKVAAAVCNDIKIDDDETRLVCKRGHDQAPEAVDGRYTETAIGHYTSEWVMVARSHKSLEKLVAPTGYDRFMRIAADKKPRSYSIEEFWQTPHIPTIGVWTDDYSNLLSVLR